MPASPNRFEPLFQCVPQRERWEALAEALANHPDADEALYALLPRLQEQHGLPEYLLQALPPHRAAGLQQWLPRRLLTLPEQTLDAFCALATTRARLRDARYAPLDPRGLVATVSAPNFLRRSLDQRVDGAGWLLSTEASARGPADQIEEESWLAIAHGRRFELEVGRVASSGLATRVWEEERVVRRR